MDVINEEELISRLVDMLTIKKITYQKKLNELEKINRTKSIFSKHTDSPMTALINLADSELHTLLSEYMNLNYSTNDLKVKKYWMNEGYSNVALQSSKQYKEVKKIFENLIDKIQAYLDYSSDFKIDKNEALEKLALTTSFRNKLVNNEPIRDLSSYYSILTPSETLTEKDVYKYLVAISINNINLIENLNFDCSKIEIDNSFKNSLIVLIENIISQKEFNAKINDNNIRKSNEIEQLLNNIKSNYDQILNVYPEKIKLVMEGLWEKEDIQYYIDSLALPITIIKGTTKGLDLSLCEHDINILNKFIDCLEKRNQALKIEIELQSNIEKYNNDEDIEKLNSLLFKLEISDTALFECNDFIDIVSILNDNDQTFDYITNIINLLNQINLKKYCNIVKDNNKTEILVEKKTQNINISNNHLIKKIEQLFNKYGFNYNSFPKILIEELCKNSKYEKIEDMLDYINSTSELSFLKDYTLPIGSSNISKQIQEIRCSQLCFILSYSSREILDNFISISQKDNIELSDIFSIPKVFASKNNEGVSGTYEDFIINEKFIKDEYPTILKEIMSRCPFVLGTDSYLFRKNIELTEIYGMCIKRDSNNSLPSPLALTSKNFEYIIDRYIEVQDYEYIEQFRYQLETNSMATLKIKYKQLKDIDINDCKSFNQDKYFKFDYDNYLKDLTMENIAVALNDSLIKWLDRLNEEVNEQKRKVQYVFNNIYISRLKVLKYYGTLLINEYPDKNDALLYSITKDSYLTKGEFENLKKLIYKGAK